MALVCGPVVLVSDTAPLYKSLDPSPEALVRDSSGWLWESDCWEVASADPLSVYVEDDTLSVGAKVSLKDGLLISAVELVGVYESGVSPDGSDEMLLSATASDVEAKFCSPYDK